MTVPEKVLDALRRDHRLPADSPLLVGVSGGADSLALLHVLVGLRQRHGLRLHAVTVEHGVRGKVSVEDAEFVVRTCNQWQVPVSMVPVRAKLRAGSSAGIEAALRALRYTVFAKVAAEIGATTVAVAHQADDQAETVLMHLLRGSGLRGLGGMAARAPMPGHPELTLLRPLLDVTRDEIDAYCTEHGLTPRVDATNADTHYFRNRIRHDLLPTLRALNPQIDRALTQLADIASVENDYMEQQLAAIIADARDEGGSIRFSRLIFAGLHPALQRRFVAYAASRVASSTDVSYERVIAAVDLALHGDNGARALLPGEAQLRIEYQTLVIEKQDAPSSLPDAPLLEPGQRVKLDLGVTPVSEVWAVEVSFTPLVDTVARITADSPGSWLLRTRQNGDTFAPLGMNGHTRRVSRWMIDRKIPQAVRDHVPLLDIDGQIAAIAYGDQWTVTAPFRADDDSPVVYFRWLRRSESTV